MRGSWRRAEERVGRPRCVVYVLGGVEYFSEVTLSTSLVLVLLTMTPTQLTELRQHRDAEEKRADLLTRDGKYGEAVSVLQALKLELETKLKGVPRKEQEGAYLATSLAVLKKDLDELTSWKDLAAKSTTSAPAAMSLVLGLMHPTQLAFDGFRATVRDSIVQKLIASIRKLDPNAAKLLGPRKVKVVVTGKSLDEAARASIGGQLVTTLKALGHDAALGKGTESFEVDVAFKGPVSAHLIGDDVDECALIAVAKWPSGGLARLDLTAHGMGDEETDGNCFKQRVDEVVNLAAEQILRTAMRQPLAVNHSRAEGPNGVFE